MAEPFQPQWGLSLDWTFHPALIWPSMPESVGSPWLSDDRLRRALRESQRVAVLTGSGISAESGIPTFRGADGLWKRFRPEELASIDAFMANPELVWEWYRFRRGIIAQAQPNAGHLALARWETQAERFALITQNVDGLHVRAGSRNVIELHGNIWRDRCMECGRTAQGEAAAADAAPPLCPCGGRLRPDVVWFGELLPARAIQDAEVAARECDLFLAIGTSAVVHPAAGIPRLARMHGALLVEINPEVTPLSHQADVTLFGSAGEILPALVEALEA